MVRNVGCFEVFHSESGTQGDFGGLNVVYAPNASGKSTICDILRSLTQDVPDFVLGRNRFGAATPAEIELLLCGTPSVTAGFQGRVWQTNPPGAPVPRILLYDDRFVADNVLVG
jgi:hypothetical protein